MKGRRVVVYGDIVADRFIYGMPKRISREAPVLILRQYRDDILLGGGGNAINNVRSLGGVPAPVSVVGRDAESDRLLTRLHDQGIDCSSILRIDRYHTPTKTRVLGGMPHASRQQIVRFDLEDSVDLATSEIDALSSLLRTRIAGNDGAIVSDYGYGVVLPTLVADLIRSADRKPVNLDSRHALLDYPGVTAATPNEEEAAAVSGIDLSTGPDEIESLRSAATTIQKSLRATALLITRGSRGMALFERDQEQPTLIPVHGTDQVADVTGAGDTVIAAFTLALAAGATFIDAARIANYAASVVVMKMGTATVSSEELRHTIERDESLPD